MINQLRKIADLFELHRGGSQNNLRSMEGMRGFAVFMVFLVHFADLSAPFRTAGSSSDTLFNHLYIIGNLGVDLFFVLSGYLIYGTLISRPQPFLPYFRRRVRRIYPAFLAVFALYLCLSFLFPAESKIPQGLATGGLWLVANLLLLPGLFPIEPMITVAWSLSYEFFYYLAIPALVTLAGLRATTPARRFAFFLVLAGCGLLLSSLWGGPARLAMFLAGILVFELMEQKRFSVLPDTAVLPVFALGLLAPLLFPV